MNIKEQLSGCLYGYAIGDALGLGTELMDREEVRSRYPGGLRDYAHIVRDAHRAPWKRGQFTHDTDVMLAAAHSLADCDGPDPLDYAAKLSDWLQTAKIHDVSLGLRWIVGNPRFTKEPEAVSHEYYERTRPEISHNEALGRAMIIGLWDDNLGHNVSTFTRLTHDDPRCVASGLVIGHMANHLFWHHKETPFDHLYGICQRVDSRAIPYLQLAHDAENIDALNIDDEATSSSSLMTMSVALWALWHLSEPLDALYQIVDEGGDADTNASLALGLMGLKYGYDSLPGKGIETLLGAEKVQAALDRLIPLLENFAAKRTE